MWYYDGRIRIKPDWNVKGIGTGVAKVALPHQNKTRLECKVPQPPWLLIFQHSIRIKPDWNVKILVSVACGLNVWIRIKPDWNVK